MHILFIDYQWEHVLLGSIPLTHKLKFLISIVALYNYLIMCCGQKSFKHTAVTNIPFLSPNFAIKLSVSYSFTSCFWCRWNQKSLVFYQIGNVNTPWKTYLRSWKKKWQHNTTVSLSSHQKESIFRTSPCVASIGYVQNIIACTALQVEGQGYAWRVLPLFWLIVVKQFFYCSI